jgi:hypothetical protein
VCAFVCLCMSLNDCDGVVSFLSVYGLVWCLLWGVRVEDDVDGTLCVRLSEGWLFAWV